MKSSIQVALIGVGGFARIHYAQIVEMEREGMFKLSAVMIRPVDMEASSELVDTLMHREIKLYSDYNELLHGERGVADLIVLPVPIGNHCEMSIAALEAGYHVLCEKPLAGTVEECLRMEAAQEKSGRQLAISFQHIYSSSIQKIKRFALSGSLGALLSAKTMVLWPRAQTYYGRSPWAGKLTFRGRTINDCPLMNATSHYLNNMLFLAGKTEHDSAQPAVIYGENYRVKKIESCDTQFLRVITDSGARLHFLTSHATDVLVDPISEYCFEYGNICWSFAGETVVYQKVGSNHIEIERFSDDDETLLRPVYVGVYEAIQNRTPPAAVVSNSYQQVLCVEKSFESGPIIDVPAEYIGRQSIVERDDCLHPGDVNYYIRDIGPLFGRLYAEELSFYEAGCKWAAKSLPLILDELSLEQRAEFKLTSA